MPIELSSDKAICSRCGMAFSRRKGYFPVSYAVLHKGIGYIPVCKTCIDTMYNSYLAQCNNAKDAVRQMCRKLDLFWSENVYDIVSKKSTTRSMMTQYIAKINTLKYVGKSYDDTLSSEGILWTFGNKPIENPIEQVTDIVPEHEEVNIPEENISDEVIAFWGSGYTPGMYIELEQRRSYWMSRFPKDIELDIGTEALIRQICSLELDINRDRAAGRSVEKSVTALNTLLGSANLKPVQRRNDDVESELFNQPLGVWLDRFEYHKPLPEIDDDLKDVNGLLKYVFIWLGHLCKMLNKKAGYTRLYEKEIERLKVEKPEFADEDDEDFLVDALSDYELDDGDAI